MAHSVGVWEENASDFGYHPVGYMQISPESMHSDVAQIAKEQKEIGYESTFIEGETDSMNYMKGIFHDWQHRVLSPYCMKSAAATPTIQWPFTAGDQSRSRRGAHHYRLDSQWL